jgi:ankyrin repeat protein
LIKEQKKSQFYQFNKKKDRAINEYLAATIKKGESNNPLLVDIPNQWGETPLWIAARYGKTGACRRLIRLGALVNIFSLSEQNSPLHIAKNNEIVKILLEAGADIQQKNYYGCTPVLTQVQQNPASISILLKAGANPNDKDTIGYSVLHKAVWWGCSSKIIQILLDNGANPSYCDPYGNFPFDMIDLSSDDCVMPFEKYGYIAFAKNKESYLYTLLKNNGCFLRQHVERGNKAKILPVLHKLFTCVDKWQKQWTEQLREQQQYKKNKQGIYFKYPSYGQLEYIFGKYAIQYAVGIFWADRELCKIIHFIFDSHTLC